MDEWIKERLDVSTDNLRTLRQNDYVRIVSSDPPNLYNGVIAHLRSLRCAAFVRSAIIADGLAAANHPLPHKHDVSHPRYQRMRTSRLYSCVTDGLTDQLKNDFQLMFTD